MTDAKPGAALAIHPLTPERWDDLVDLFGPERGANSGCWCMWWRIPTKEFRATARDDKRDAFARIVRRGPPPGILAYRDGIAVGWCAVGPRSSLPRLNASRVAAPLDEDLAGVWAINCFYMGSGHRRDGLMRTLTDAAVAYAKANGARRVEACPIEPARKLTWGEGYVGIASVFFAAGFREVARRSAARPLVAIDLA